MTSLEMACVQGVVLLLIAPIAARLTSAASTSFREKRFVAPWEMYRREPSVVAAVVLGTTVLFAMLLPLLATRGFAALDGTLFTLIGLLAIVSGGVMLMSTTSIIPAALGAFGAALFALGIATARITVADVFLALANDVRPSVVLAVVAITLVLLAIRMDGAHERVRDVRMVLSVTLGVFIVNLVALMTTGTMMTHDTPVVNALILAGKALGAVVIIDALAYGVQRYGTLTPSRLVRIALFLSLLSVVVTLW